METIAPARRGRPRKNIPVPQPIAEGESASSLNIGDWQVSGAGIETQANAIRPGEGWADFVDRVIALHRTSGWALRHVWHACPMQGVIEHENGSIVVSQGESKAYLNTGEFVEI